MIRAAIGAAFLLVGPAAAECRLALALALDVSSSVDAGEDLLQRRGLAAALLAPEVQAAFFASSDHVSLAAFEWSGRYNQEMLLDWTAIDNPMALHHAAETLVATTRGQNEFPTAMGYALGFGSGLFDRGPGCLYRTLDIAGDGVNNEGFGPSQAYAAFRFSDVTVNGLVVNDEGNETGGAVISFYRSEVLHGPGAFLEIARGFDDYERAMRRKLERELTPPVIGWQNNARPRGTNG